MKMNKISTLFMPVSGAIDLPWYIRDRFEHTFIVNEVKQDVRRCRRITAFTYMLSEIDLDVEPKK